MPSQRTVIVMNDVEYHVVVEYDVENECIVYPLGAGHGSHVGPVLVNIRVVGVHDIIIRHPSGDLAKSAGVDPPNAGPDLDNLLVILNEVVSDNEVSLCFGEPKR